MTGISFRYKVLILCILGSLVRLLYGYLYAPWTQAPDQLAWELLIDQPGFRYDHLIHYPHEGGSILVFLFSKFLKLFSDFHPLTVSAFILDFLVRLIQIHVVKRVFNENIAQLFGIWTVFAAPFMLPWGTVNFGLHAISSVFPFLFMYFFHRPQNKSYHQLLYGLFVGFACWFSYSNIILIPVVFLFHWYYAYNIRKWAFSILGLTTVLVLHLLVRNFLDSGFHLQEFGLLSIRGEHFSIRGIPLQDRLIQLPKTITNAAIALPQPDPVLKFIRPIYLLLVLLASTGLWISFKRKLYTNSVFLFPVILVLFVISYLFSPFFYANEIGNYVTYRHWMYILPLLSLFLIAGLSSFRHRIPAYLFLALGIFQAIRVFQLPKPPENKLYMKATGWIIGTKFGHDPSTLTSIIRQKPEDQEQLVQGIGWGVTASLFSDIDSSTNEQVVNQRIDHLIQLSDAFPGAFQKDLLTGVEYAFSNEVMPRLTPEPLVPIREKFGQHFQKYRKK